MKLKFTNNSTLSKHFLNYQESLIKNNNKLVSSNLSDTQITQLYDKKYNLSEFDIYRYITAYDYLIDSLGHSKYTLTEGITTNKNKYNNILVDLFYQSVIHKVISYYSTSIVFGIKKTNKGEVTDLNRSEKLNNLFKYDPEAHPCYELNY
jgi:hypothetical protein